MKIHIEMRHKKKTIKRTITHIGFPNHSCLLPQRTSDIRNLEGREGLLIAQRERAKRGWGRVEGDRRVMVKIKFKANRKTNSTDETATNS